MTIKEYQDLVEETAIYPEDYGLIYTSLGLAGEAGEVAEKIKKLIRDKSYTLHSFRFLKDANFVAGTTLGDDIHSIGKELGDVLWYVAAMCKELGLDLEQVMQMNYDKLIARKVQEKLQGDGDDREVDTGAAPTAHTYNAQGQPI